MSSLRSPIYCHKDDKLFLLATTVLRYLFFFLPFCFVPETFVNFYEKIATKSKRKHVLEWVFLPHSPYLDYSNLNFSDIFVKEAAYVNS